MGLINSFCIQFFTKTQHFPYKTVIYPIFYPTAGLSSFSIHFLRLI